MSFGFAIGDFISAGNLAWDLYTKCYLVIQDAPQEFRDLVDSLSSVRIAMRNLEEEIKNPDSALSHAGEDRVGNVVSMVGAITRTLKAVEKIVNRYQVIVEPTGDLRSYGRRLWSKIKWSTEVSAIQDLKQKLMFHTNTINLYLMTVGNSSLGRIENIMNMLVASISPQMNASASATVTNELQSTSLHLASHELSTNNNNANNDPGARLRNGAIPPSGYLQELPTRNGGLASELPGVSQNWAVELPDGGQHQVAELPGSSPIHELGITAEETAAAGQIFAEAERKLLKHGRPAVLPSRNNSTRVNPLAKVPQRKPIPGREKLGPIQSTEPPNQTKVPSVSSIHNYPPPLPEKVRNSPEPAWSGVAPTSGNLSSSVNYMTNGVVEKAFLTFKDIYVGTKRWPSDFRSWIRIAEWWFLKGELYRDERKSLTHQAYINFAKCSWILSQIMQRADGFNYEVSKEDESHFSRLQKRVEMDYSSQDLDAGIPTSDSDLYGLDLGLLEPTQPEEEYCPPTRNNSSSFFDDVKEDNTAIFRSFVAVEFGISRPSRPAADIAKSYLFVLHLDRGLQTAWIFICNQVGTLRIVKPLDRENVGPELDGSNIRDWIDFEFNGQSAYAGFSSTEAAVPYAVEYNCVRKELLEKPICIFEITVEKARYIAAGHEVNPVGVGPASLALMEMNKAEDERCHYREIVMRGHFTTREIPLHVIKVIQSPSSPIRVQLWWPTFDIPREDIRRYLRGSFHLTMGKWVTAGDFFTDPHLREHRSGRNGTPFTWVQGFFVEIQFRSIEERLLDIDVRMQSDRMLDVIFKTPEDAREFIMHAGGMMPRITERLIFQRDTPEKRIKLFRAIDGTIRLCYEEADTYCNFIVDQYSSCNITIEGSVSLWSLMWSPFGSVHRSDYSYLVDSIDLGVLEPQERDQLISTLTFPERQVRCASVKIKDLTGVRGGVMGRLAKAMSNLRVSAKEAMLVLTSEGGIITEFMVLGKLYYEDCSRDDETMRLMANVVTIQEGKLDKSKAKLSVHLSITSPKLHTFNRERSMVKQARGAEKTESEIGELKFIVDDISAWRAALANLELAIIT